MCQQTGCYLCLPAVGAGHLLIHSKERIRKFCLFFILCFCVSSKSSLTAAEAAWPCIMKLRQPARAFSCCVFDACPWQCLQQLAENCFADTISMSEIARSVLSQLWLTASVCKSNLWQKWSGNLRQNLFVAWMLTMRTACLHQSAGLTRQAAKMHCKEWSKRIY